MFRLPKDISFYLYLSSTKDRNPKATITPNPKKPMQTQWSKPSFANSAITVACIIVSIRNIYFVFISVYFSVLPLIVAEYSDY